MPNNPLTKKIDPKSAHAEATLWLKWAEDRYEAEVTNRPVHNKNRHALDTMWKQVIKRAAARVEATKP